MAQSNITKEYPPDHKLTIPKLFDYDIGALDYRIPTPSTHSARIVGEQWPCDSCARSSIITFESILDMNIF